MARFFVTFGQGWTLRNNFVRVEADGFKEVSEKMRATYGEAWSNCYSEGAFNEVAKHYSHFVEVPFGTPNLRIGEQLPTQPTSLGTELPLDNVFGVERLHGVGIIITKTPANTLTRHEALLLAAWLTLESNQLPNPEADPSYGEIYEQIKEL